MLAFPTDRPISGGARFAADAIAAVVADLVSRGVWKGDLLDVASVASGGSGRASPNASAHR